MTNKKKNERRRQRYASDPAYRDHVLKMNAERRAKNKAAYAEYQRKYRERVKAAEASADNVDFPQINVFEEQTSLLDMLNQMKADVDRMIAKVEAMKR